MKWPWTLFLAGRLPFPAISRVIDGTMAAHDVQDPATVEIVRAADRCGRDHARALAGELGTESVRS